VPLHYSVEPAFFTIKFRALMARPAVWITAEPESKRFAIAAPREIVFDVIASPYLGRTPRALQSALEVWERGADMVLAAHFTPVKCGVTPTVETVRFTSP